MHLGLVPLSWQTLLRTAGTASVCVGWRPGISSELHCSFSLSFGLVSEYLAFLVATFGTQCPHHTVLKLLHCDYIIASHTHNCENIYSYRLL